MIGNLLYATQGNKRKRKWRNVLGALGAAVAAAVLLSLILTGMANEPEMIRDKAEHIHVGDRVLWLVCYKEEGHIHDDGCYSEPILVCEPDENEEHVHDMDCYGAPELICPLADHHYHDEACYIAGEQSWCGCEEYLRADESAPDPDSVEQAPPDAAPAGDGHVHTAECFGAPVLICADPEHNHDEKCFIYSDIPLCDAVVEREVELGELKYICPLCAQGAIHGHAIGKEVAADKTAPAGGEQAGQGLSGSELSGSGSAAQGLSGSELSGSGSAGQGQIGSGPIGSGLIGFSPMSFEIPASDLTRFVTSVIIRDSGGVAVPGENFYYGEDYTFSITFKERAGLNGQFAYDAPAPDGRLTYQLPAALRVAAPVTRAFFYSPNSHATPIGEYSIDTDGWVTVLFYNVDDKGNDIGRNFIDHYTDTTLQLDIKARFSEDSAPTYIDFGNNAIITVRLSYPPGSVKVTKKIVSEFDRVTETVGMSVDIEVERGVIDNLTLRDVMTLTRTSPSVSNTPLNSAYSRDDLFADMEYLVIRANGSLGSSGALTPIWNSFENAWDAVLPPGLALAKGDTLKVIYKTKLAAAFDSLDASGWLVRNDFDLQLSNTASVKGKDQNGRDVSGSSLVKAQLVKGLTVTKRGSFYPNAVPTPRLRWTADVENPYQSINGQVITDEWIGAAANGSHKIYADSGIKVNIWTGAPGPGGWGPAAMTVTYPYVPGATQTDMTYSADAQASNFKYIVPDSPADIRRVEFIFESVPTVTTGTRIYTNTIRCGTRSAIANINASFGVSTAIMVEPVKTSEWVMDPRTGQPEAIRYTIEFTVPAGHKGEGLYVIDKTFPGGEIDALGGMYIPWMRNVSAALSPAPKGAPASDDPAPFVWRVNDGHIDPVPGCAITGPHSHPTLCGNNLPHYHGNHINSLTVDSERNKVGGPVSLYGLSTTATNFAQNTQSFYFCFGQAEEPKNIIAPTDANGVMNKDISAWQYAEEKTVTITYEMVLGNKTASYLSGTADYINQPLYEFLNNLTSNSYVGKRRVNNRARVNSYGNGGITNDYLPLLKTGSVSDTDEAVFNYQAYLNWAPWDVQTNNPVNTQRTMKHTLFEQGREAIFEDTFDPRLEYVPGSFMVERYSGTMSVIVVTPFGPYDRTTREDLVEIDGNTIRVDFNKHADFSQFDSSWCDAVVKPLIDPANITANTSITGAAPSNWYAGANPQNYRFKVYYQLRVKQEYRSYLDPDNPVVTRFNNTAKIYPTGPVFGGRTWQSGCTVSYGPDALYKQVTQVGDSNNCDVEIIINPSGLRLNPSGEDRFTARDTMSDNMAYYLNSINIYTQEKNPDGSWSGVWKDTPQSPDGGLWTWVSVNEHTLDFILPDRAPVKIKYTALVTIPKGATAPVRNEVSVFGYTASAGKTNFKVLSTGMTGWGNNSDLTIFKVNEDTGSRLNGAEFKLYMAIKGGGYYDARAGVSSPLPSYVFDAKSPLDGSVIAEDEYGGYGVLLPGKDGVKDHIASAHAANDFDEGRYEGVDFYHVADAIPMGDGQYVFDSEWISQSHDAVFMIVETGAPLGYALPVPPDNYSFISLNALNPGDISGSGYWRRIPDSTVAIKTAPDNVTITNSMNAGEVVLMGLKGFEGVDVDYILSLPFNDPERQALSGTFRFELTQVTDSTGGVPYPVTGPLSVMPGPAYMDEAYVSFPFDAGADGTFQFNKITGLIPGYTYYFKITEDDFSGLGWTVLTRSQVVSVTLTEVDGEPRAVVNGDGVIIDAGDGNLKAAFTNRYYGSEQVADAVIRGTKTVNGIPPGAAIEKTFQFKLTQVSDENGGAYTGSTPITRTLTRFFDADGEQEFEFELDGLVNGDYYFRIEEDNAFDLDWWYDRNSYVVKVEVEDGKAEVHYPEDAADGLRFVNILDKFSPKYMEIALSKMMTYINAAGEKVTNPIIQWMNESGLSATEKKAILDSLTFDLYRVPGLGKYGEAGTEPVQVNVKINERGEIIFNNPESEGWYAVIESYDGKAADTFYPQAPLYIYITRYGVIKAINSEAVDEPYRIVYKGTDPLPVMALCEGGHAFQGVKPDGSGQNLSTETFFTILPDGSEAFSLCADLGAHNIWGNYLLDGENHGLSGEQIYFLIAAFDYINDMTPASDFLSKPVGRALAQIALWNEILKIDKNHQFVEDWPHPPGCSASDPSKGIYKVEGVSSGYGAWYEPSYRALIDELYDDASHEKYINIYQAKVADPNAWRVTGTLFIVGDGQGYTTIDQQRQIVLLLGTGVPFNNTPREETEIVVGGEKFVTGAGAPGATFTFKLTQLDAADPERITAPDGITRVKEIGTPGGEGRYAFMFDEITGLKAGVAYYFLVEESGVDPPGSGWAIDKSRYIIKVAVAEDLSVTMSYAVGDDDGLWPPESDWSAYDKLFGEPGHDSSGIVFTNDYNTGGLRMPDVGGTGVRVFTLTGTALTAMASAAMAASISSKRVYLEALAGAVSYERRRTFPRARVTLKKKIFKPPERRE